MSKFDHARLNARDRVRQKGSEDLDGSYLPEFTSPPKARKSKSEILSETAEAIAKITRIVRCECGHQAAIAVPPAWANRRFNAANAGGLHDES